jgi:IS1 family transposase
MNVWVAVIESEDDSPDVVVAEDADTMYRIVDENLRVIMSKKEEFCRQVFMKGSKDSFDDWLSGLSRSEVDQITSDHFEAYVSVYERKLHGKSVEVKLDG